MTTGDEAPVPDSTSLKTLAEAAQSCRACPLWQDATQTVFGRGPRRAGLMLVGEQPGDREDLAGRPFVGPAGRLLAEALEEAGIDARTTYLTNVVKHFKFQERGKRRIHKKPNLSEIRACRPWFDAELRAVHPKVVVALGATAAQALFGTDFRVSRERGRFVTVEFADVGVATVHPSSILRAQDEDRRRERAAFVKDLKKVAARLAA
jgi:uracil-DNA glycosylase family protein